MKKYLYGFKLYFLNSFHYRFNTIINLIFGNLSIIITIMFWALIYKSNSNAVLNGFTLSDMVTYFVIGGLFRGFIFNNSGFTYSRMIKSGGLSSVLVKPYSISLLLYFNNLSNCIINMFPQLVLLAIVMPLVAKYFSWNLNAINILLLLLFILISTISSHIVWSIFGFMAFWLEEADAVMWSFAVLLNLMTGMFIPLDFFPKWSVRIIEILPFSSWGYIPTKLYLGLLDVPKTIFLLAINLGWVILLLLLHNCIWKIGIKRYSSIGG